MSLEKPKQFYITLIFSGLLILCALLYLQYMVNRLAQVEAPLIDAAMEIKLELALSHLAHQQILSAEPGVTEHDVESHLHNAIWYANAMLNGDENEEGRFVALENKDLQDTIRIVHSDLLKLDEITHDHLQNNIHMKKGDAIDQSFDQMFERTVLNADRVETQLQQVLEDGREVAAGRGFIVFTGAVGLFVFMHFFRLQKAESRAKTILEELSTIDGLTGVDNRRAFDKYLSTEWGRAQREKAVISIIICDLDFFKEFNDSLGHLAGDDCLKEVARVMKESLSRSIDHAARYGGEEFTVTLPSTDSKGALRVMSRITSALTEKEIHHPNSTVSKFVTLSAGIATVVPNPNISMNDLLLAADKALYQAKENGRNKVISVNL